MATLHVRNVPDELYEELRKRAERDGRSIGAEAIALLRFAIVERARVYGSVEQASGRGKTPFTRRFVARAGASHARARALPRARLRGGNAGPRAACDARRRRAPPYARAQRDYGRV